MRNTVLCTALAALLLFFSSAGAHAAETNAALKAQVETVLREHPDMLMNILREHGEELYGIIREASQQAQQKAILAQREKIVAQWKIDLNEPKSVTLKDRIIRGNADAPVTIVAFSDFTCPYCEQAAQVVTALLKHYGPTVRLIFKNTPLASHASARTAAEYFVAAARQSPQKAWQLYDTFFANRAAVTEEGAPFLRKAAADAGLDMERLAKDMQSPAVQESIDQDVKDAQALGFKGTPYFLVNNIVIRGALPFDLFSEAVEMALERVNSGK